ncbi:zonadhesin [Agrilus planipennis]|uniref:Zonadhesin n=1 Tax=Agrilus planipennis TaxID=224129 RepID=A0A1W4XVN0_AGRPL|nr:zonadhesin [Agrilus planipennis]
MYRMFVVYSVVILAIFTQIEGWRQSVLPCPGLKLKFGRIRYRQKGRFVKFQCNTGYITAGEKYSICFRGEWDNPPPRCVRATCPMVRPPINGLVYPSHRGAVLNFFCKPDYVLRGPNITYCDGRQWSDNLPSCVKSNTKPALSCDFESEDLCGWTHDLRHDFDWIRMNFSTPSGYLGTGPAYDHTKGEQGNGYYMYIESSSRTENETARLISPIYDKVDTNACFKFFYHMYGSSIGTLRIYLKKISDSWDLEPSQAIFNKSGNQGNDWLEGFVKLGPINEDFQIVIEGINGPSYVGDLAIDDVQLIENCTEEDEIISTTMLYETAPVFAIGTCANRCFNDSSEISEDNFQISCDCVENCMERNTCCPDFIALCIADSTDDSLVSYASTPFLMSTSKVPNITENQNTNKTYLEAPTIATNMSKKVDVNNNSVLPKKENKTSTNIEENPTTSGKKTSSPNTSKTILPTTEFTSKAPPSNTTLTTRIPLPTSTKTTRLTTTAISITKNSVVVLPTLKFLTPPPTQPIIQKLPKTAKTKVKVTKTPSTTAAILKTTSSKPTLSTQQTKTNDIVTLPTKKAVTFTLKEDEKQSDDENNKESDEVFSGENTKLAKIINENSKPAETKFTMPLILSITIIILIVCIVLLIRRYSVTGCRKMNRFKSSGDSQSDVRFLTSDEQLDFTLASPDSYSTL